MVPPCFRNTKHPTQKNHFPDKPLVIAHLTRLTNLLVIYIDASCEQVIWLRSLPNVEMYVAFVLLRAETAIS